MSGQPVESPATEHVGAYQQRQSAQVTECDPAIFAPSTQRGRRPKPRMMTAQNPVRQPALVQQLGPTAAPQNIGVRLDWTAEQRADSVP